MPALAHVIRRRRHRKRRRQARARRAALWYFLVFGIPFSLVALPMLAGLGLAAWLYLAASSHMPTPAATVFLEGERGAARFLDRDGTRALHEFADRSGEDRTWLTLDELPPHVIAAATLVDEAPDWRDSARFDAVAVLLELWRYIIGWPPRSSQSLPDKLARDAMLPLARTSGLDPRLLEIVLAAESARLYSAEELLAWRLNSGAYGHDSLGIEAAAQRYLGKSARDLTLAEATLLAPVAAEPDLNPQTAPVQARERSADLLFALLERGDIDQAQFDSASAETVTIRQPADSPGAIAPAFVDLARQQAVAVLSRLGWDGARMVARGGLTVRATLDWDLQARASALAAEGGELALLDARTGQILALVGPARVASRQPAPILQPFVYMDAFLRRAATPASMLYDTPQSYPGRAAELIYTPAKADGTYRGPVSARSALAGGLLPPAAQIASENGIAPAILLARALGVTSLDPNRAALEWLERGGAVSALDAAYAYSVLAGEGAMRGMATQPTAAGQRGRDPLALLEIRGADGGLLWAYAAEDEKAYETVIIEGSLAYMINDILADAATRSEVLQQPRFDSEGAAILTGASGDGRDRWAIAYNPDLALALSTGVDEPTQLLPGVSALLQAGLDALDRPPATWQAPAGIEEYLVCELSGLLPPTTDHCPTRREIVPRGAALARDDRWQTVEINRATGLLATVNTPANLRESVAFFIPPDELLEWWIENDKPLPPSTYSADGERAERKAAQLTAPADYAYAGSQVEARGVVNRAGALAWRLEYGADVNPDRFYPLGEPQPVDASGEIAATWETALLSGIYTLRLTVTFADGSSASDSKLLTFDNTPPSLRLRTSDGADRIAFPEQRTVSLLAEARDNLRIERVEFYAGGELLGIDRDWPFGLEAPVTGPGEIAFRARAYDQVGNRAAATLDVIVEGE